MALRGARYSTTLPNMAVKTATEQEEHRPRKGQEAIEVMTLIADSLGVDLWTVEGVKRISEITGQTTRSIYRWRKGGGLSLRHALPMLQNANLLRPVGEARGEPANPHQALEHLVAAVAELVPAHARALADLKNVRTRLERAEKALAPSQAARKRATGK